MLVNKKVGDRIGWLDEDYFWYGEDLDFCFRVKKNGFKVIFYPYVSITHYKGIASGIKKHSTKISSADNRIKKMATNARFDVMRIFYNKHYKDAYPTWLKKVIFTVINIKEKIALNQYK